jgi:hypothetical protein
MLCVANSLRFLPAKECHLILSPVTRSTAQSSVTIRIRSTGTTAPRRAQPVHGHDGFVFTDLSAIDFDGFTDGCDGFRGYKYGLI